MRSPTHVEIAHLLESVSHKGARLWLERGELRYRAPKGTLTQEELQTIRACAREIVGILGSTTKDDAFASIADVHPKLELAPLSFQQLAYWNAAQLVTEPSLKYLVSATRIRGCLSIRDFERSFEEMLTRHEVLRAQFVAQGGVPAQRINRSSAFSLQFEALAPQSHMSTDDAVRRRIDEIILQPVHVDRDPLFEIRLIRISEQDHVLVVAMEHIISDAASVAILTRDVLGDYTQRCGITLDSLPNVQIQYADYARWQRSYYEQWSCRHRSYWNERLESCGRTAFPAKGPSLRQVTAEWAAVPVRIPGPLKAELTQWSRQRRSTLVMAVFTAYAATVLRWCDTTDTVIRYQTDGRTNPKTRDAIGYFASTLHLRITSEPADDFVDLLNRVAAEYLAAHEHSDLGFLDAQMPPAPFTKSTTFNWVPYHEARVDAGTGAATTIQCKAFPFEIPQFKGSRNDREPVMLLYESETDVAGSVRFPLERCTPQSMQRFARNFEMFLSLLAQKPHTRIQDIEII